MRYTFKPSFFPTFIFMLIFPALIALGCWQLNRAQVKQLWMDTLQKGQSIPLAEALNDPQRALYHHIILEGEFLNMPPLLLMHQSHAGKPGVHVIHFFKIQGQNTLILVNRGFIDNGSLADIPPPPGQPLPLHGIIDRPKPDRFILGSNILDPALRPLPVQRLDVDELGALFHVPLMPLVILADQDLGDGLIRNWQITPRMPPEKHLGYAVQWFALALCLAVLYIVVHLKKRPS